MKNGEINLVLRPLRIDGVIQTIINIFTRLNNIEERVILSDCPEDLPLVSADENRLTQILYNLIGNAVKFTSKGYIIVSVKEKDDVLEICIRDTGVGIPEDKLEDIFKSFEQVDCSVTRRYEGTGLELSITKQLVELHGGRIWVTSRLGEGSSFYFTLPVYRGGEMLKPNDQTGYPFYLETKEAMIEESESPPENQDIERILLVDDDRINLKAASSLLKLEGYQVVMAMSGSEALLKLAENRNYSLVILDVMMKEMSGYELCRIIREESSNVELPVLMLTAGNSIKELVLGFKAGANDYLLKPYEPEELYARVRTLVELHSSVSRAVEVELAFLQAQIKPHFLFNTLNTISSFCDTNPELAGQLIDNDAGYLRETFDFKAIESLQPIEKELHLVQLYVEIEKARFGDELQVSFDNDPTIQIQIPRMLIQPLVENAINHGLRKKRGKGTVVIRVQRVSVGVMVSVEDDGQGIEPDKLARLLSDRSTSGIGLWNINNRMKKLYGRGIHIESNPNQGTVISFLITE